MDGAVWTDKEKEGMCGCRCLCCFVFVFGFDLIWLKLCRRTMLPGRIVRIVVVVGKGTSR